MFEKGYITKRFTANDVDTHLKGMGVPSEAYIPFKDFFFHIRPRDGSARKGGFISSRSNNIINVVS
jgi:hypothetical protein